MTNEQIVTLIEQHIKSQMNRGISNESERESQLLDLYALGYLFGFSCGAFTHFKIKTYRDKIFLLSQIYSGIFGKYGRLLLQESLDLQNNRKFQEGANSGWEEISRYLHREETPFGLTRFLQDGQPTLSLTDWFPKLNDAALLAFA